MPATLEQLGRGGKGAARDDSSDTAARPTLALVAGRVALLPALIHARGAPESGRIVRTGIAVGAVEGLAKVGGQGVGGGDGAGSGLDVDGAMAAGRCGRTLIDQPGRLGLMRRTGTKNASGCCGRG
jgi:hypothetical protein